MRDRRATFIVRWLSENPSLEPPARLDVVVQRAIVRRAARARSGPVLRPVPAMALAAVSALCLVTGLAVVFAETEIVLPPAQLAFGLVLAYLAVSATVTLPVLMNQARLRPLRREAR